MYSLQKRLTLRLLASMLLVMLALLIIAFFSVRQIVQDYIVTRLQHDAESLVSALETDQQGQWLIEQERMSAIYNRVSSGHYYQVRIGEQLFNSRSLFDSEFPNVVAPSLKSKALVIPGVGDERWLVWYQQVNKRGANIDIWLAEDMRPLQLQLIEYLSYAALIILLATSLLIYIQRQVLRHSFRVFEHLRDNLTTIKHDEPNALALDVPIEVVPLVSEIRRLVKQLRKRIERTRNSIGNLAHELKRPMQLLSIQRDEGAEYLHEPLEEMGRIIDRELKRAKISGSRDTGGLFDPGEEMPIMIEVMRKIYPRVHVFLHDIKVCEPVEMDRDDALEIIGNLLENACKFAVHQVDAHLEHSGGALVLKIEDDGPGLEEEVINEVLHRGARLDESVPGSGLGLSIVKDILEIYQGEMQFARSKLGGLLVKVAIPSRDSEGTKIISNANAQ